jgi:hypothetical protein
MVNFYRKRPGLARAQDIIYPLLWRDDAPPIAAYPGAMHDILINGLKWFASASGIIAAGMVAHDGGRKLTGWGFALFVASALAWIAGSVLTHDWALGTQNVVLFAIDVFGVYRYLIRKKPNG